MRFRTLETVESLTSTPRARRKNSCLWGKVASGCSLRFASKSFLALSSSFGLEPGRYFGASDLPLTVGRQVALDGGDAHTEGASGLDLGHPPLDSLDDLFAQVF